MTTKILRRALFGFAVAAGTFTVVTHSWAAPPPTNATVFVNLADPDYCIGVYGGATSDLSSLVLWQCDGSANQTWVTDNSFSANTFFLYERLCRHVDVCQPLWRQRGERYPADSMDLRWGL